MKKREKLKMMAIIGKFFGVVTYIMTWYGEASEDSIIDTQELMELGAGICGILGLKTEIKLPTE